MLLTVHVERVLSTPRDFSSQRLEKRDQVALFLCTQADCESTVVEIDDAGERCRYAVVESTVLGQRVLGESVP